ncbi:GNAT family N-acetyltransferase [Paraburkholderia sp. GAS82]|uniref:GNAT family N-acetyltransferase n=1 Tax=Paraburkholderia sp. GAS82 TaxID=3035137 RepID=UPI003D24903D
MPNRETSRINMRPIHTTILDHRNPHVAEAILAVQHAAYRQEAALLGVERFPPLDRNVADIFPSEDRFFGAWIDDAMVGVASIAAANHQAPACISSMTVSPSYQRRGVASALMSTLLAEVGAEPLTVSTGARNSPAIALYVAFGFVVVRPWRLEEFNLELVELGRAAAPLTEQL